MLTASSMLAVFSMLGISSLAVFWARRVRLPHTVFLVIIGLTLGILIQFFPSLSFFGELSLTPELLFFLLLPTLIFEAAYNINARRMVEDSSIILVLAVLGLLTSAFIIGGALYILLALLGLQVPFIVTLIFGTLISVTDPIAVIALFKEYGAPRRMSLIFEGESLFNDATAVAFFLILLEVARHGFYGFDTVLSGTVNFSTMMIGGALFGVLIGSVFATLVGLCRENEIASITLTIVLAHLTFILTEIISHHLVIGSLHIYLSPFVSTTVAALLMGNYGRSKIHPRAEEFVENLWSQLAFMANSLIFILIGMLFVPITTLDSTMLLVIGLTILVVAAARALSIYPLVAGYNSLTGAARKVPIAWQHLLAWGSLRGSVSVVLVLMIPDSLTFPYWNLDLTPKEFLLALTVGCIFTTLFIKATTMQRLMRYLKLDALTDIERVEANEARALVHHEVTERIRLYEQRGYIDSTLANQLCHEHQEAYESACNDLAGPETKALARRILRLYAIGIERLHLKELYHHHEVNERVFRRLSGKLQLQFEAIEQGNLVPNMSIYTDDKDIFDIAATWLRNQLAPLRVTDQQADLYMYYRAQTIISRKVLKELRAVDKDSAEHIFSPEALLHVITLYTEFKNGSEKKMKAIEAEHPTLCRSLARQLAIAGTLKIEDNVLTELYERQLITPKLYVTLREELR